MFDLLLMIMIMLLAGQYEDADPAGLVREQVRQTAWRHRRFVIANWPTYIQEPARVSPRLHRYLLTCRIVDILYVWTTISL